MTPEQQRRQDYWLKRGSRTMSWRGVMLLGLILAAGIVALIVVLPIIMGAANG